MLLLLLACLSGDDDDTFGTGPADDSGDGGATSGSDACPVDAVGSAVSTLQDPDIVEASGLVVGQVDPGLLWTHNDSGDEARLFAVDPGTGTTVGSLTLQDVPSGDWEDLAIGPGPGETGTSDGHWLYVGDIGDNAVSDGTVRIWMLPEPAVSDTSAKASLVSAPYPDGPHDAEALLADPLTGELFLLTKELGAPSQVFRIAPHAAVRELVEVASFDLAGADEGLVSLVTGASISPDGRCVFVRTYSHVIGFARDPARPLEEAFAGPPLVLSALPEAQGEAIAADAQGYWTLSEGKGAALHRFVVEPPP